MPFGSQARWLAPVALAVTFLAVMVMVASSTGGGSDDPPASRSEGRTGTSTAPQKKAGGRAQRRGRTSTTATTATSGKKTHTVQPGDTFGSIAEETGVSVAELQEANPTVDPQGLTIGQDLRLPR